MRERSQYWKVVKSDPRLSRAELVKLVQMMENETR